MRAGRYLHAHRDNGESAHWWPPALLTRARQLFSGTPEWDPQPHSLLVHTGRPLTVLVNAAGHLQTVYCVDATCRTPIATALAQAVGAVSNPTAVADPSDAGRPLIVFFHSSHTGLAAVRCAGPACTATAGAAVRPIASTAAFTPDVERFDGELGVAVDPDGHFHILFRRVFPQVGFSQVIVTVCSRDALTPCTERPIASGPDVGAVRRD